jgi:predicted aminopeptidase
VIASSRLLAVTLAAVALAGCANLAYYSQAAVGQYRIQAGARSIDDVLRRDDEPAALREKLQRLPEIRQFAVTELGLPDSDSYGRYVRLDRPAIVWSLVATPTDSLAPKQWCFPIVGCTSYRGYFDEADALAHAAALAAEGWDTAVEPVPAYSTLGWFADPLPSTVAGWPLADIAGLVFHELAHENLYVAGDSAFNEAYATLVEHEGVRRWLARHGSEAARERRRLREQRKQAFLQLLAQTRIRLEAQYREPMAADARQRAKQREFAELRLGYAALRARWDGYPGYDRWFDRPLNNAHLAGVSTYHRLVPALASLLQSVDGDMAAFHAACRELAQLPRAAREARLLGG